MIHKIPRVLRTAFLVLAAFMWSVAAHAETITYFHNDVSGTPLAATDAAGNVVWKESYRPYGDPLQPPNGSNALWFTGKPFDTSTGLSYFGARYYDPLLGRFAGIDPEGFNESNLHSFNRYAYANNNPNKFIDPDGRVAETILDVVSLGLSIQAYKNEPSLLNAAGVAYDGIATAVPFLPAGFGIIKNASNAADALNDGMRVAEGGAGVANNARKETGSYTNTHVSGRTYDGKGSRERSQESGRRVEKETRDQHVATEWRPASTQRNAFKDESRRLDSHGGPSDHRNHNKIESPGKKYRIKDGD